MIIDWEENYLLLVIMSAIYAAVGRLTNSFKIRFLNCWSGDQQWRSSQNGTLFSGTVNSAATDAVKGGENDKKQ